MAVVPLVISELGFLSVASSFSGNHLDLFKMFATGKVQVGNKSAEAELSLSWNNTKLLTF